MTGYRLLCCWILVFLFPVLLSSKVECQGVGLQPTSADVLCPCPKPPLPDSAPTLLAPVAPGGDIPLAGDPGGQSPRAAQDTARYHEVLGERPEHIWGANAA